MTSRALIRVLLKENFSLKRLFGFSLRENKVKAVLIAVAIIYAISAMFLSLGYMFFDLGATLKTLNQTSILLNFIYVYAFAFMSLMVLLRANSYLFQYRDYQILGPLPLPPKTIMTAKLIIMLIMMYVPTLLMIAPIAFSYFYQQPFNVPSLGIFIISLLMVPLLPIVLISFVSLFISRISARFRYKNIINIVISTLLLVGYIIYSVTATGQVEANPLLAQVAGIRQLSAIYWPLAWFVNAVHGQSWLDLGLLVGTHLGLFIVFIFVVARLAIKTNQLNQVVTVRQNSGPYHVRTQSVFGSLVKKEFRKFFSVPLYALNSGVGLVIMLVLGMISLFSQDALSAFLPMINQGGFPSPLAVIIFVGFCVAMTYTPAISLSLEGKNIWIVKSLPLDARTIVFSKIVFNLSLVTIPAFLAILMFSYALQIPIVDSVLLLVWAVSLAVLISVFDAMLNLLFPKMTFTNEVEVIKQSVASLFAVFGGFLLLAISGVGYYFLIPLIGPILALLAIIGANILLAIPIVMLLVTKSSYYLAKI